MAKMGLIGHCPFCTREWAVEVPEDGYFKWKFEGMLIQDAMPDLSPETRECLISGLCEECQKKFFKEF